MPTRPELLAVELSSFQLHDMPTVNPTVGVLTNLAPDHLDRYPTVEDYYQDKTRLFANATSRSMWVTNADDAVSAAVIGERAGRRRTFSVRGEADGWLDRASGFLMLGGSRVLPRSKLPLLGDHNIANALAAALAVHAVGLKVDAIARGLATATPLKHRMEPIREVGQVLWINDSKATNVSSTEVAVQALDRPFVLLLGGRHKGEPYTRLAPLLERCRAVIGYGEAGPKVAADLGDRVRVTRAGTFEEVVATAASIALPGDAVLLSPACSSYDMFNNYEERGARFRQLVEAM
jgi:UDP-N-acetylmuramoylalanine--D-glutamate ligase